jgi:DNA-directed RNA polymerase sigma subunit (sigma70/sigma32)
VKKINPPDEVERLIKKHQGLAVRFAMPFKGRAEWGDIIAACKNGLARAAQDYDSDRGAFSTYAWPWMRKYVEKAVSEHTRLMISQNLGPSLNLPIGEDGESQRRCGRGKIVAN